MQTKLQLNKKTLIKKQISKLSLEIKFSQINSTWYDSTINKNTCSPIAPTSSSKPTFHQSKQKKSLNQSSTTTTIDQYEYKLQSLELQLQKQLFYIQKIKHSFRQKLDQFKNRQLNKQKMLRDLTLSRKNNIQEIKRQFILLMKSNVIEREAYFQRLNNQLNQNVQSYYKLLKKAKRQWKKQLRSIIQKVQIQSNKKKVQIQSNQKQRSSVVTFYQLKQQILSAFTAYNSQIKKLQLQISTINQNFLMNQQIFNQESSKKHTELQQVISKLQKQIRTQIRKQHIQSQNNRQKLLLLLEQNVDKIEREKKRIQTKKTQKYKPFFQYRHLKQQKSQHQKKIQLKF